MAVSHQWFVQWSAPPMLVADISSQYNKVNEQWNDKDHHWSDDLSPYEESDHRVNDYTNRDNWIGYDKYGAPEKVNNKDRNSTAGITLWLAMLGVTSSQILPADVDTPPFNTLYKWREIDFEFPTPEHRRMALSTGKYVPANVLPLGLEVWGSRVWVTLPSWRNGVPATLATVSRNGGQTSPLLKPYPNWNFHRLYNSRNNCSGLISVFRMKADTCGRLWVLDSGQIDSQDNPKQICPPSIVLFDMVSDKMLARYTIPKQYVLQDSLFTNIIVDTRTLDCSDLHLYITDTWRYGLLVFRERDHKFWRFTHPYFYPDPLSSLYTLHGVDFQWMDGIFGLALTQLDHLEERTLIFHPMSSSREFYVSTKILRDYSKVNSSVDEFNILGEFRGERGQTSASVIDKRGVMHYGLILRDSVGCWDTAKPYRKRNLDVVAKNTETLIFPNDIKVDEDIKSHVWVITNRLPIFQARKLGPEDYNYRILYADIEEAVRGSVCDPNIDTSFRADIMQRK